MKKKLGPKLILPKESPFEEIQEKLDKMSEIYDEDEIGNNNINITNTSKLNTNINAINEETKELSIGFLTTDSPLKERGSVIKFMPSSNGSPFHINSREFLSKRNSINIFERKNTNNENKKKKFISKIIDHVAFDLFIFFLTIYALFSQDIKILSNCPIKGDFYFDCFTIICLIIFLSEIFASILVKNDYLFSFFFWLDLISTISLVFDISLLSEEILKFLILN